MKPGSITFRQPEDCPACPGDTLEAVDPDGVLSSRTVRQDMLGAFPSGSWWLPPTPGTAEPWRLKHWAPNGVLDPLTRHSYRRYAPGRVKARKLPPEPGPKEFRDPMPQPGYEQRRAKVMGPRR